jgi:hypothetical protein
MMTYQTEDGQLYIRTSRRDQLESMVVFAKRPQPDIRVTTGIMGSRLHEATTQQPNESPNREDEANHGCADIMGQFSILDAYTQVAFGFELSPDVDREAIVSALQAGLDRLIEQIPWLGWQVGQRSSFRTVIPWPQGVPRELVRVKYCDDTVESMAQLLAAGAPISKLDGRVLAPWPGIPQHHGITGPVPVIALQANFVQAGLILTLSTHHTVMDATATFQFVKLFTTVLRGDEIPATDLQQANRDRSRVIDLIPAGEPLKDHSHLRRPPGHHLVPPASPLTWCYFKMPVSLLTRLVRMARDPTRRVTDEDVLHAFYWQRLCAVRLARGMPADTVSAVSRAIDGRMALGIPSSYMGSLVCTAITRLPMGKVVSLNLQQTAQLLRRDYAQANTPWAMRSYATFIARERDRRNLMYTATVNCNTDVGITSGLHSNQTMAPPWGPLLGACSWRRRLLGPPIPGSMNVHPAEGDAIPLLVSLPQDDLEALKQDAMWRQYTKCIG